MSLSSVRKRDSTRSFPTTQENSGQESSSKKEEAQRIILLSESKDGSGLRNRQGRRDINDTGIYSEDSGAVPV